MRVQAFGINPCGITVVLRFEFDWVSVDGDVQDRIGEVEFETEVRLASEFGAPLSLADEFGIQHILIDCSGSVGPDWVYSVLPVKRGGGDRRRPIEILDLE